MVHNGSMDKPGTARELLGQVLAEGRAQAERSPEAVAAVTGVAGRTVRRLEDAQSTPRAATLQALASFYGMDTNVLMTLSNWDNLHGEELAGQLRELAVERLGASALDAAAEQEDELGWLAMRLARSGRPRELADDGARALSAWLANELGFVRELSPVERRQLRDIVAGVLALEPARRELFAKLVDELRGDDV